MSELKNQAPFDLDAERAVIGSMIYSNDTIADAEDLLSKDDFYDKNYALMFDALVKAYNQDKEIDPTIALDLMRKNGVSKDMLTLDFIKSVLVDARADYLKPYADSVSEKSLTRKALALMSKLSKECYEQKTDISMILDYAEEEFAKLTLLKNTDDFKELAREVDKVVQKSREASERGSDVVGIPSGYADIDRITKGFKPADVTIIAARPGVGKTALALNMARHIAVTLEKPVAIFSLEMSSISLAQRMMAMQSHIDSSKISLGKMDGTEWIELESAASVYHGTKVYIDDVPDENLAELRAKCRKAKKKYGVEIIFIDYIQLVTNHGKAESRQQEVAKISRTIRNIARQLEIPIVAVAQLSREVEHRSDSRPMMSDIRESGQIEQDAANIIFIHRDTDETPEKKRTLEEDEAEVIFAKVRDGKPGKVKLKWLGTQFRFVTMEKEDADRINENRAKKNDVFMQVSDEDEIPFK